MPFLMVRQKVKDFDQWYAVFESHAEAQRAAGLEDLRLLMDVFDAHTIVCLFRVVHMEKARAFVQTPLAVKAQKDAGVVGTPEILFLDEI